MCLGEEYKSDGIDFTLDYGKFSNLPVFVEDMAYAKRHVDVNVDPALSVLQPKGLYSSLEEGLKLGLFINSSLGTVPLKGWVIRCFVLFVFFGYISEKYQFVIPGNVQTPFVLLIQ